jgi:hypothetical protein
MARPLRGAGIMRNPTLMVRLLALFSTAFALAACGGVDSVDSAPEGVTNDELNTRSQKLTVFDCKSDTKVDDEIQRIQFSVKNITNNHTIEIRDPKGHEDPDYNPIHVTPKEGRVSELNDNLSAATGSRMLRISGDSDGFYLLELALYKDSGYEHGYLRIYGPEDDGPHQYAKVTCDVTEK